MTGARRISAMHPYRTFERGHAVPLVARDPARLQFMVSSAVGSYEWKLPFLFCVQRNCTDLMDLHEKHVRTSRALSSSILVSLSSNCEISKECFHEKIDITFSEYNECGICYSSTFSNYLRFHPKLLLLLVAHVPSIWEGGLLYVRNMRY